MAAEALALRDQLVNLANSKYQGSYVFGGQADDDAPFDAQTAYTNPASGGASVRYAYDSTSAVGGQPAGAQSRSVNVADNVQIVTQVPGDGIFSNAISALERLARSLSGYQTNLVGGVPDGTGTAYTMPADFGLQSSDLKSTIDAIESARSDNLVTARVTIGSKLKYLETISEMITTSKTDAITVLANLQDANIDESASKLSQTQTALQASYTVSTQMLRLSILDYL